ncbi:MAG TPA: NAD-dependent epimerase/dehydratase family protein [Mycobacteriales bacterium]|jgi:nucleoside-diphosphate-sugar epimerase|nr:NAD-dependent epimerase/dehydratase family protein [Mycobacteriales bacterium]
MARVVVVGASGNVGSRTVAHLREAGVEEIVGVARRTPDVSRGVHWVSCDIGAPDAFNQLTRVFEGAEAVVHLAWQIQPGRSLEQLHRTNVVGSRHVADAVAAAGVPTLLYASSVGAYSAGPKDRAVDESWPTEGTSTSTYARHKAAVERALDRFERHAPDVRLVRFRPGLVFQREAASEIARYFLGPYIPLSAIRRRLIPMLPTFARLAFQAVHADDVGAAFARALADTSASGAYNLAADPVLDTAQLAEALRAKPIPVPFSVIRAAGDLAFRARLVPTDAGWLDMAAAVPLMSTHRARTELGWVPRHSSTEALLELIDGMQHQAGAPTPPLLAMPATARRVADAVRTAAHGGPGSENP